MKEYYKAYEDRYKKVHKETGLAWAGERPSPILKKLLKKHHANKDSSILEVSYGLWVELEYRSKRQNKEEGVVYAVMGKLSSFLGTALPVLLL